MFSVKHTYNIQYVYIHKEISYTYMLNIHIIYNHMCIMYTTLSQSLCHEAYLGLSQNTRAQKNAKCNWCFTYPLWLKYAKDAAVYNLTLFLQETLNFTSLFSFFFVSQICIHEIVFLSVKWILLAIPHYFNIHTCTMYIIHIYDATC